MDYEQLVTFNSLVKTRSFTRTAEELNIVQSTVTARIKMLEEELGERLFHRKTRSVEISDAGKVFYDYAENIVILMNEVGEAVRTKKDYKNRYVFAAVGSIWEGPLFKRVAGVKSNDTAIRMITDHSHPIINRLSRGSVDIGFVYIKPAGPHIESKVLYSENLILVGRKKEEAITPKLLLEHNYIHYNWGESFMEWFENEVGKEDILQVRVDSINLAMNLLLEGGVGFLPEGIAAPYIDRGDLLQLKLSSDVKVPEREIYMIYKREDAERLRNVFEMIQI
ncbi:LysR family transcriptional regulator [Corticicoccus populi]|uniref:LysR family transcriptional regulator n=1 Tax=Corticicoccus populi TaxID=1812821 RepID=A0ABW5X0K3_9STAP